MFHMPFALLVGSHKDWGSELRTILESRGFAVYSAPSCTEAALLFESPHPPHLVFTASQLPDETWADLLAVARQNGCPVSLVVVSPQVDVSLYIQVLEQGGFDFVVPPLQREEINHVIRNAMASVEFQRRMAEERRRMVGQPSSATREDEREIYLREDGFHVASLL